MTNTVFQCLLFCTGANTNVQLVLMALAAQRNVAVRITANATTPTECVCVSPDTPGRRAPPDCVLKDTTASCARGSVRAIPRTPAGTLK